MTISGGLVHNLVFTLCSKLYRTPDSDVLVNYRTSRYLCSRLKGLLVFLLSYWLTDVIIRTYIWHAIKPADNYYICRPLKFTWKNYCKAKGLKIFQGRDKFFSGLTILPPWLKLSASELIFRSYSGEPAIPHFDNRTAGRVWPQSTLLRVLLECNCGVQHPFINTLLLRKSRDFIFFYLLCML